LGTISHGEEKLFKCRDFKKMKKFGFSQEKFYVTDNEGFFFFSGEVVPNIL
jgi:hypothetical protein